MKTKTASIDSFRSDIPFQMFHYPQVDSTNETAKQLFKSGQIACKALIIANSQTAGKGTQGRKWLSPDGAGLYMSVLHVMPPPLHNEPSQKNRLNTLFTMAAGLACVEALHELTGLSDEIRIKPVNDIYHCSKKLGGILVEGLVQDNIFQALITGIGININNHPEITADERNTPTSLSELFPSTIAQYWQQSPAQQEQLKKELANVIAKKLDLCYTLLENQEGSSTLQQKYHALCIEAPPQKNGVANNTH